MLNDISNLSLLPSLPFNNKDFFGTFALGSTHYRREGGVTRVVTRGPGALRGPVENKVCIFGYEFSISSIGRAGP